MQQGKSARFIPLCMIAASYFLASFVYAGGISPPPPPKAPAPTSRDFAFIVSADNYWFRPLVTVTGGTSMSTVAHSKALNDALYFEALHKRKHEVIWGGFVGTELPLDPKWFLQMGLGYYQPRVFTPNGMLTEQVGVGLFNEYLFGYSVIVRQLLVESKLLWNITERFHPYITVGLGSSFNKAYGYNVDAPLSFTFNSAFANHTITTVSYNVGIGLDVDIANNIRLGGAYRYSDFGKVSLGYGHVNGLSTRQTLSQSHLYVQEVVAELSYLFF